ncbi:MAG: bacterial/archaeal transporter family-2 protein [Thermoleophilaceae bacterium]|nr:bacterial/archaeal transporter family-2 protein [Thermoleophilaceae bacterium]
MSKVVALVLSAAAGMLVAMQPPINSKLGQATGNFAAAAISFTVGTIALVVVALVAGGNNISAIRDVPWWYFAGGFIGAVFVASSLVTVRTLGAGGVVAATIAGQLTFSLVIDRFGLLGLEARPLSVTRVIGVVLLAAGVLLVVRD